MQKGVLHVSLFPSDLKLHQHPLTGFVTMFEENPREDTFFPLFFFFFTWYNLLWMKKEPEL